METVGENLIDGSTFRPVRGLKIGRDAADLPQVAGLHIGIIPLLEQPEAAVGVEDAEVIKVQAGLGNGKFTAPDLVRTLMLLQCQGNLLGHSGAVVPGQQTYHPGGADAGRDVNIQGADLLRGQCTEGGLVLGKLAVVEDSHGSLLGI